jgi:hypothetical protein
MLRKPRRWTTRLRIKLKSLTKQEADPSRPFFMHPLIFLSGWVALGILFGFQEPVEMSFGSDWKIPLWMPFVSWTLRGQTLKGQQSRRLRRMVVISQSVGDRISHTICCS